MALRTGCGTMSFKKHSMKADNIDILRCPDCQGTLSIESDIIEKGEIKEGKLRCSCGKTYPITEFIPRFTPTDAYVKSFSLEWTRHRVTQLDSANEDTESEERFEANLDFPLEELEGKFVLDAGCGMGRFAEIVLKYGGKIVGADLSYAVDAAFKNMGVHKNAHFIQADLFRLPLKEGSFDIIYSLGVLHHTPDPRNAFLGLVKFLKPGGKISVTLYSAYNKIYVGSTNFWRNFTTKIPPRLLYYICHISVPLYYLYKIPGVGKIGLGIFPINLHPSWRWRVLDTFDCYSPRYQSYHTHFEVFTWFDEAHLTNIRVLEHGVSFIGTKK